MKKIIDSVIILRYCCLRNKTTEDVYMNKQQEYLSAIDSLKRWLRKNRLSHSAFAQLIGISKYALSWILHDRKVGRRFFTLDQAVLIEKITNCEIPASGLLLPVLPSGYLLAKADDSVAGCGAVETVVGDQRMIT